MIKKEKLVPGTLLRVKKANKIYANFAKGKDIAGKIHPGEIVLIVSRLVEHVDYEELCVISSSCWGWMPWVDDDFGEIQ